MNFSLNSTQNSTQNVTFDEPDFIAIIDQIVTFYLFNIMIYAGAIFNFICIIIFIEIIRQEADNQGHLFKYLLIKSICDLCFCLQNLPRAFYFRSDSSINRNYSMQIWYIYSYYFLYSIFSQLAVWFEVAASFDCLFLISMKFKWHKTKACFLTVVTSLVTFWILFYIPNLFWFKIKKRISTGYMPIQTPFGKSKFIYYHLMVHNIMRDIVPIIITTILNSFILYIIKQSTNRRKSIQDKSQNSQNANKMVRMAQNAERNKIKMMFTTSLINIFHIPNVYYNLNISKVKNNSFFSELSLLLLTISYVIPIFTYTAFNSTFKRSFKKFFFIIFKKKGDNATNSNMK
jgi:hypothetical protein